MEQSVHSDHNYKRIMAATMTTFSTSQWLTITGLLITILVAYGWAALMKVVSWQGMPRGFHAFQSKMMEANTSCYFQADFEPQVPVTSFQGMVKAAVWTHLLIF